MKAQASKEFDRSVKAPAPLYRKIMLDAFLDFELLAFHCDSR